PVMLAISDDIPAMSDLIRSIFHLLPRRIYSHLSAGLPEVLAERYTLDDHGPHYKMLLRDQSRLDNVDTSEVIPVTPADRAGIEHLFEVSYPGNWFDPRMLETGCYYGVKRGDEWLTVSGVHVYSPEQRVAALGNITTHPAYRGQGLAKAASAKLCIELARTTDIIGLNVKADNASAIACYKGLGFEKVADYSEYMLELK
ncbi:MAG: GNAT family N-acetyltransferase, partial [Anaerolineae bacterium]|nr:GNAT family N-acetyltransferase [Anaerolineae bacterium]